MNVSTLQAVPPSIVTPAKPGFPAFAGMTAFSCLNHASSLSGEGPSALICSLNSVTTRTKVGASAEESHSILNLPGSIPAKASSFFRTATLLDAE